MTKVYALKPAAQTTTPHSFSLNRNRRRIRSMTMAACQRNEIWNTATTHCQYTINKYQPKLPNTIILMTNPVLHCRREHRNTELTSPHVERTGMTNHHTSNRTQQIHCCWWDKTQDAPIVPLISSRTRLRTKQQKTAHTTLPKELADTISPIASQKRSRTTTLPKKAQIEDTNSIGKAHLLCKDMMKKKKLMSNST